MSGYYIPKTRNAYETYELNKVNKANDMKRYLAFTEDTKVYFLSEALYYLLSKSLGEHSSDCADYGRELCRTFVREEGYNNLMKRFSSSTLVLAEAEQCVKKATDSVVCKCDKDNNLTWTITNNEQRKFFDSLRDLPVNKLTKVINQRVCDAAEEFVQNNINMKLDIEDMATKAKERIDAAKEKYNDEKANEVQQEQMLEYKRAVNNIKSTSKRNVYEHMMNLTSKAVLENDSLRESFINESGQFDMALVESRVRTMYTFLEMVNSLKIKKVDSRYIQECLASIK